jgi:hypothetical protein
VIYGLFSGSGPESGASCKPDPAWTNGGVLTASQAIMQP